MHTRHDDVLVVKMKKVDDKSGDVETECECVCIKTGEWGGRSL